MRAAEPLRGGLLLRGRLYAHQPRATQRSVVETKFEQLRDVIGKHIAGTKEKLLVFTDPTHPGTRSNRCTQGPETSWTQGPQDNEEGSVPHGCATLGYIALRQGFSN